MTIHGIGQGSAHRVCLEHPHVVRAQRGEGRTGLARALSLTSLPARECHNHPSVSSGQDSVRDTRGPQSCLPRWPCHPCLPPSTSRRDGPGARRVSCGGWGRQQGAGQVCSWKQANHGANARVCLHVQNISWARARPDLSRGRGPEQNLHEAQCLRREARPSSGYGRAPSPRSASVGGSALRERGRPRHPGTGCT